MRVTTAILAVACLVLAGCRMAPGAVSSRTPIATNSAVSAACPDGRPAQPGLSNFGAYIGTWQSQHTRDPKSPSDYTIATVTGRITVRCNAAGFVTVEAINFTFQVPRGRALQFALTELPADSSKIYDHAHSGCQTLQYRSELLAHQLGADDSAGLADITLQSSSPTYNAGVVSIARIEVAGTVGADSQACF